MANGIQSACPHDIKYGPVDIHIHKQESCLSIKIETVRLRILSVTTTEFLPNFIALYGDKEVNKLVGSGATIEAEAVTQKIHPWISRWTSQNPFAGYAIVEKSSGDFVGQIILKPVKDRCEGKIQFVPGMVEIGYLSMPKHWHKGFGKEYTHG